MTADKSCAERITSELQGLNVQLRELQDKEAAQEIDELALSVDSFQLTSICLSYGGPSSYLEVKHQGSDIVSVSYRFSDWYDTATVTVSEWEPAYAYAVNIIESMGV
jgi:hypothetical protein